MQSIDTPGRQFCFAKLHGCRFPGCHQARWVDAHHIHHWAQGRESAMDNLVLLCRRHHP